MPLDLTPCRRVSRLRSTRTEQGDVTEIDRLLTPPTSSSRRRPGSHPLALSHRPDPGLRRDDGNRERRLPTDRRQSASPNVVIPAKAGTQSVRRLTHPWVPACAGMTKGGKRLLPAPKPPPPSKKGLSYNIRLCQRRSRHFHSVDKSCRGPGCGYRHDRVRPAAGEVQTGGRTRLNFPELWHKVMAARHSNADADMMVCEPQARRAKW